MSAPGFEEWLLTLPAHERFYIEHNYSNEAYKAYTAGYRRAVEDAAEVVENLMITIYDDQQGKTIAEIRKLLEGT